MSELREAVIFEVATVIKLNSEYQVTAISFGENQEQIISGGIDNEIKTWDLRNASVARTLYGHKDTISYLKLSIEGKIIRSKYYGKL